MAGGVGWAGAGLGPGWAGLRPQLPARGGGALAAGATARNPGPGTAGGSGGTARRGRAGARASGGFWGAEA